ncbi:helix-turn-helix domain-containing protein [Bradyrhizobium ottawaense]|uniref:helix-turn-helix domain-containing protein n=1 Tax=Bradyrhizobium ottawaense TaxID=931866 RepID=UPI001260A24E
MDHRSGDARLGEVFTFDEVCTKLRISRQKLSDLIRGTDFYTRIGRVYRFSDADILAIWESMRPHATGEARLPRSTRARQVGASSEQLKKLLTGKPRKRCILKVGAPPELAALFTGKSRKRPE